MNTPRVKICGTSSRHDALLARESGADFVGVVLDHPVSPRHVSLLDAPQVLGDALHGSGVVLVALSVNKPIEWHESALQVLEGAAPRLIMQLHGDEEPDLVRELKRREVEVWAAVGESGEIGKRRALEMLEAGADAILMDARARDASGVVYGGTGQRGDWDLAASLAQQGARVVLAGGLDPENVAEAIAQVGPWAVDCVSGVERRRGEKDAARVRAFVQAAKRAGSSTCSSTCT